jgi:DsbC/DsbD-like thiol-disulfide interchange protein
MRLPSLSFVLYFLFAASMPALAASSSVDADHVQVQLIVLPQGLNRGEAANAGLYFKIEPGWHIYWKNTGDAGLQPHVQWTLPQGITVGTLQFPAPKRLPLGPLMDFGYEDEVLFPLKLSVTETVKPGPAVLHASGNWLVCQTSCVSGRAELELSREIYDHPVKSLPLASDATIFKRFIGKLPKPLPTGYKVAFRPSGEGFRLFVQTGESETEATFFPVDQGILDNAAPQKLPEVLTPVIVTGALAKLPKTALSGALTRPGVLIGVLYLSALNNSAAMA